MSPITKLRATKRFILNKSSYQEQQRDCNRKTLCGYASYLSNVKITVLVFVHLKFHHLVHPIGMQEVELTKSCIS